MNNNLRYFFNRIEREGEIMLDLTIKDFIHAILWMLFVYTVLIVSAIL